MHALRAMIREQMDARGMTQAELVRESGLHKQVISKMLKDDRPRLPQPLKPATVAGLARAFTMPEQAVWATVAAAMGLPVSDLPAWSYGVSEASDDELLAEVRRRMRPAAVAFPHAARDPKRPDPFKSS